MTNRQFQLVDVFYETAFGGNPLPVILDGKGLSTNEMQSMTRWMDHSETAFLLPPTDAKADYRVRIFTLEREMPFAGHPTLGSCHAWLTAGHRPKCDNEIIQECEAGLIAIRKTDAGLAFSAPSLIRSGPVAESKLQEIAQFLGISRARIVDAQWADNGPGWIAVLLESAAAVLSIEPARDHSERLDVGIVGPYPDGSDTAFELRAFFTDHNGAIREDPVTDSLNASVAQWLFSSGKARTSRYVANQGARVGRSGRVYVEKDEEDGTVWIAGNTATVIDGQLCASLSKSWQ